MPLWYREHRFRVFGGTTATRDTKRVAKPDHSAFKVTARPTGTTVAIAGLGAIGLAVAEALDREPGDLHLVAVCTRDREAARAKLEGFQSPPQVVATCDLDADIIVEAAAASVFDAIAGPAIERGRTLVVSTVGALLARPRLIARASVTGARIVVATGAILGLDAVRAAALSGVDRVTLETRKNPASLAGAPYLTDRGIDVAAIEVPTRLFHGNAAAAALGFPANANVAAALALAGIGAERTEVEIWADPTVTRNTHTIRVESDAARLTMTVETAPSLTNPRTGQLAPLSVLACLRGLTATLKVGS